MNYREMIDILKKRGSRPGLESIRNLLDELGNPQRNLRVIHVAGTNGKGSVLAFTDSILRRAGFLVGHYLSPTIRCYEERFQINGRDIEAEALQDLYDRVWEACGRMEEQGKPGPTLFEAETAIAYLYFSERQVDYALIECGMGGEADATNVIDRPALSLITSISFDHMSFLGDTLQDIARQKAGIIKDGCPVVMACQDEEAGRVIREVAGRKGAPFYPVRKDRLFLCEEREDGSRFCYGEEEYEIFLPGYHQVENALCAIEAAGILSIPPETVREGLAEARWPGRLEIISRHPLTYRDGAHNEGGAIMLSRFVQKHFTNRRIIYIMGILKDKEYEKVVEILCPTASVFYVFTPGNERGLPARVLAETIKARGKDALVFADVNEALSEAEKAASSEDVLIVCGSLSFMEEMSC